MTIAVEINNLTFSYKHTPVLEDISFSVQEGEFLIIVGPNGSGKTTLVKIISNIIGFQQGRLAIFGRPVGKYTKRLFARKVAYVPQAPEANFPFSVRELVLMGRAPYIGVLGIEGTLDHEIADKALAFTGIEYLAERRIDQLSGGERQMAYIAMAVCREPAVIVLDEPTASLDYAHQVSVMDLMEKMKIEKNVTVIMVSHDVNLAAMYGDRFLLVKDGRKLGIGKAFDVISDEMLEQAYNCSLVLDKSPVGDFPRVTPLPGRYRKI